MKIKKIEKLTDSFDRYDLEVEGNHNFFAGGILVHNCRMIVTKDGAFTRNGKQFKSVPHILEALKPLFMKDPDLILDGEAYNHELHDDFNKIMSVVRKTKLSKKDLEESKKLAQFHCYDAPRIGLYEQDAKYNDRRIAFETLLNTVPESCIQVVPSRIAFSEEEVKKYHDEFVSQGYEGIIIRIIDSPYENKRTSTLLKYKVFDDDEFIIEGIEEGTGNKAGMAATIITHSKSGEIVHPNIKAPHDTLRSMLRNKERYIGKTCTVRYFGLTPDKLKPRFPYMIDIDRWLYE